MKEYSIIYADPPWRYDFAETKNRAIENHYPTMTTAELCNLKVPAAKDCVLYLWATAPKLIDALEVIKAWGFEYKTHAIWDKELLGMGYCFRGQHELLMVATRGHDSPPCAEDRTGSVLRYKRGRHSSKPGQIREQIARWFPAATRVEMFARPWTELWPKLDGWDAWGNELESDIAI